MTREHKNWEQLLPQIITVFECNVNKHHNYYGKTLLFVCLFVKGIFSSNSECAVCIRFQP